MDEIKTEANGLPMFKEPPPHVIEAALVVSDWAEAQGFKSWRIAGCYSAPPAGFKLMPDVRVGAVVRFRGNEYLVYALGDRPGTFDLRLTGGRSGDSWRNVPPDLLEMVKPAPEGSWGWENGKAVRS